MRRTTLAHATAFALFVSGAAYAAPPHADSVGAPNSDDSAAPASSPPDVPASDQPDPASAEPTRTAPTDTPTAKASAQSDAAPAPEAPANVDSDAVSPLVPLARDTVGGHVAVGVSGGLVVPFGSIRSGTAQSSLFGPGYLVAADLAFGVSRTVMVGVYGEFGVPSARGIDDGKNVSTIAAGPFVRYHLVQGLRFDPWLTAGLGFRRTSNGTDSLTGIDWARLQVGGDWYPSSNFGFGPVVEMSLGTFLDSSSGNLGTKAVNAQFVVGGRIVFDGPGK